MTELNFSMLQWQREVMADDARFKVVVAGRRCGKSRLSAVTLLIEALNCPAGSAVMYVAPTMGQARTIIWELLHEIGRPVVKSSHINNLEITLVNGRRILVRGADNPDSLRGVSLSYVVLDECAFVKEDVWQKIIRAALSDQKGRALFISTPSGRNWLYDIYQLGQSDLDEEWKSWHFTTRDNETIDPKEIDAAKRTLSTFAFKQEYEASFATAGQQIFKEEWIQYGKEPTHGSYYLAVDLAGFEAIAANAGGSNKKKLDETAIAIVKVSDEDGTWFVKDVVHGRWDIKETAKRILKLVADYSPVVVGIEKGALKNAVMPYLTDMMKRYNRFFHVVDLTHQNQKKADRITGALQGFMEHGRIVFNKDADNEDLIEQILLFPSPGLHDDLVDALSYVAQIAVNNSYAFDYDEEEYEYIDKYAGY